MSKIGLTNGGFALVDEQDYRWASQWSWNCHSGYARRTDYQDGARKTVYLHREIMGAKEGDVVDHINGEKLDCRRENLRLVSTRVNEYNKPATKRSRTGLRGVYERNGRFRAIVGNKCLGTHATKEEAHAAVLAFLRSRAGDHEIPRASAPSTFKRA